MCLYDKVLATNDNNKICTLKFSVQSLPSNNSKKRYEPNYIKYRRFEQLWHLAAT